MKNLKWLLILIVSMNIGNLMAQKADSLKLSQHRYRMGSLYGIRNLTDDQRKKFQELGTPHAKEVLPLKNQLAEKKAHLRTLQSADKADLVAINATIDEMAQLQSQLMKKRAAHTQAIRKILTDDQRIAFDTRGGDHGRFYQHRRMSGSHSKRG